MRDRLASLVGIAASVGMWTLVAAHLTTRSPSGDTGVQATGALLLGAAVAVTLLPLFYLAAYARRRIAYRGDWLRALRRALLVGMVVAILVMLKALDAFSIPIAFFVIAMAAFVEIILTSRQ